MVEEQPGARAPRHSIWSRYAVPLLGLLIVLLLCIFVFARVTVTLDGYSHLYGARVLAWMLSGKPEVHSDFSHNSALIPNWLCALLLAALSSVFPSGLALKFLVILVVIALASGLYYCVDAARYGRRQRAQVLIVLLPFALNAFLTLGFYGFLISCALCLFVLGLLLRYGLRMPSRLKWVTAVLLLAAYFAHPVPVIVSFLFPWAFFLADASIHRALHRRDRWRRYSTELRRSLLAMWPWLPLACLLPWYSLRLSQAKAAEPEAYSMAFNLTHRTVALAGEGILSISPTTTVGALFIALLTVLVVGLLLGARTLFALNRLRFTAMALLIVATLVLFVTVPDQVGDGLFVANRFLLQAAFFVVLLTLSSGALDARLLTLGSLLAALCVMGFAGEYLMVSRRLTPAVAEVRAVMETIPRHSRILIMGYRATPSCEGLPLLKDSSPERHWALAGALPNELIVLNDYQAAASHFPLQYTTPRYAAVADKVDLSTERDRSAWLETLRGDPAAEYVVSWGVSRSPSCPVSKFPLIEEALKDRYDLVFLKEGASRVALWRKRG
jgi:hypothetical protein